MNHPKAKTIVIDGRELQSGMTGIGRFLHNFLISIEKIDRSNRYLLLLNKSIELTIPGENIRRHCIPESSTLLWDQVVLPRYLKVARADVFFSPYYKLPVFAPCPSIITVHDVHFFTLPIYRKQNGFLLNAYYRIMGKLYCRKARVILTVSENSKRDIINVHGVPSEKIHVVYNGVDLKRFRVLMPIAVAERIKSRFPQIKGDFILYVGNSKPHKNIPFLIKGYALLPEGVHQSTQLVLVGVDKNISKDDNYLEDRIVILSSVTDDDLPFLYNAAKVFVTASLYEGFCLPVAEAMACGTPVMVSDRGAIPEIASESGCLFNPNIMDDFVVKMTSVLQNHAMRGSMSQKGLKDVRRFSIEIFAKKVHHILMKSTRSS